MKIFTITFLFFTFQVLSQNTVINVNPVSKNKNVILDSVYSKNLEQYRSFYVYLPPKYSKTVKYPVVYATDGQILTDSLYFDRMDSLIENKKLKPFIMISVFSNEKKVENDFLEYRNYEYLKSFANTKRIDNKHLFNAHLKFFTEELIKYTEEKYSITTKFRERYLYGFSNGAAFCLALSFEYPNLFGSYILPSMYGGDFAINELLAKKDETKLLSKYYFSYGTKESYNEILLIKKLEKQKQINCTISKFNGGHERTKWAGEFLNYMKNNLK